MRLHDDGGTLDGGVDTSADQTFTIDVSGVNDPPIAGNDVATARLAGPTTINVLGNDSGGPGEPADPIKITSVVEGSRGIVTIAADGLSLTYDPIGCSTGTDVFSYTIKDTGGTRPRRHGDGLRHDRSPSAYPSRTARGRAFVTGSTIGSTTPVKLPGAALTSGTTLKSYRLDQSRSGGAYAVGRVVDDGDLEHAQPGRLDELPVPDPVSPTRRTARRIGTGPKFKVIRTQDTSTVDRLLERLGRRPRRARPRAAPRTRRPARARPRR